MTIELATITLVRKPWGRTDLRPWSELGHDGTTVGELWFQRTDRTAPEPALLLKLLFTAEPLSIQVHPDDAFAQSIGLPNGKTEAWHVLAADAGAQVALGLKRAVTRPQLRAAIEDGSVADLVRWQDVAADQTILVPAGTIHAIGAGLVIAEIQQRSDATFRLFDYGRHRGLHLDAGVGAAIAGPARAEAPPTRLSEARNVLTESRYFVLEEVALGANTHWDLEATSETWLLILSGDATLDATRVKTGEALFLEDHRTTLTTGDHGASGLLAYVASSPLPNLLQSRDGIPMAIMAQRFPELGLARQFPTLPARTLRNPS